MNIKELRSLTGLSRRKFGSLYDIPERTIEEWEAGKSQPPEYLLKLLERVIMLDFNVEITKTEEETTPRSEPAEEETTSEPEPAEEDNHSIHFYNDYDYSEYSRDDPPPGLDEFEYIDFLMFKRYEEMGEE